MRINTFVFNGNLNLTGTNTQFRVYLIYEIFFYIDQNCVCIVSVLCRVFATDPELKIVTDKLHVDLFVSIVY